MLLEALLVWVLIAVAEKLQGIVRMRTLNRWIGDRRARRVAVFSGTLIILAIGWFSVP